jgi:hypothetical protein
MFTPDEGVAGGTSEDSCLATGPVERRPRDRIAATIKTAAPTSATRSIPLGVQMRFR